MVTLFYGGLLALALLLVWRSKDDGLQKLGAWVAVDWLLSNLSYELFGRELDPWVMPICGAFIALGVARAAVKYRSYVGWATLVTYIADAMVSVAAFASHTQGDTGYYSVLNVIFVLRLMIVGGAGAGVLVTRLRLGGARALAHGVGRVDSA